MAKNWKLLHPSENLQQTTRLFPGHEEKITWTRVRSRKKKVENELGRAEAKLKYIPLY